jgi:hypothetical protein
MGVPLKNAWIFNSVDFPQPEGPNDGNEFSIGDREIDIKRAYYLFGGGSSAAIFCSTKLV